MFIKENNFNEIQKELNFLEKYKFEIEETLNKTR